MKLPRIAHLFTGTMSTSDFNIIGGSVKTLTTIAWVLVIIGALNWGLIGFFGFDLVAAIFGVMTTASRIIYALVGIAGVMAIFTARNRE